MTAKELYQAARGMYPDEKTGVGISVMCCDPSGGEKWSLFIYGNGWPESPTVCIYGNSGEECLEKLKEVKE